MRRHGFVIAVRPEKLEEYKRLHAAVWPEVLAVLKQVNISDYTIFQKDNLLFGRSTTPTPTLQPTTPP